MLRPFATFLLVMALGTAAVAQPGPVSRERQERRVVLSENPAAPTPELRIAAGVVTLVVFDAAIDRSAVELEGRARFRLVDVGERSILLAPHMELAPGERLVLRVRFVDGAAPEKAVFSLMTHAAAVDGQVEVVRRPLEPEALQAELAAVRARLAAVTAELEALRARGSASSLAELVMAGRLDARGVKGHRISVINADESASRLVLQDGTSLLASTWAMVVLQVSNTGREAWAPSEVWVSSVTTGERVRVIEVRHGQPEIAPGGVGLMVIELEVPPANAGAAFRLEVQDSRRERRLLIPDVAL